MAKKKNYKETVDLYAFLAELAQEIHGEPFDFKWRKPRGSKTNIGLCPFHDNTNSPAFSIYTTPTGAQRWYCFAENVGGSAFDAAAHSRLFPSPEAAAEWMTSKGYIAPTPEESAIRRRISYVDMFLNWCHDLILNGDPECVADGFGLRGPYFTKRCIHPEAIKDYPIGYYPRKERIAAWLAENKIPYEDQIYIYGSVDVMRKFERGLVFGYTRDLSRISSLKLRNPNRETVDSNRDKFRFLPSVADSDEGPGQFCSMVKDANYAGIGAEDSNKVNRIFLLEGEFDVLGMASLIKRLNPKAYTTFVCFGGSRLVKGAPMLASMGFPTVYTMPDNDEAGRADIDALTKIHPETIVVMPKDLKDREDPCEWAARHTYQDLYNTMSDPSCLQAAYEVKCRKLLEEYVSANDSRKQAIEDEARKYVLANLNTKEAKIRFANIYCPVVGIQVKDFLVDVNKAHQLPTYRYSTDPDDFGVYVMMPYAKAEEEYLANFILTVEREIVTKSIEDTSDPSTTMASANFETTREIQLKLIPGPDAPPVRTVVSSKELCSDSKLDELIRNQGGMSLRYKTSLGVKAVKDSMAVLDIEKRKIIYRYGEPGWHDDAFYMPNGYVDKNGWHEATDGDFTCCSIRNKHSFSNRYGFKAPEPEIVEELKNALRVVLEIYGIGPGILMINHFFGIPCMRWYEGLSPSALWIAATTGTGKTTICRALMSLFGNFNNAAFESWVSTLASIVESGYALKDLPMVIDDFKSATVSEKLVKTLIQGYGDGTTRNRGTWDDGQLGTTVSHPIRCGLICTGEDVVKSESSVMARLTVLKISGTDTAHVFSKISELQAMQDDLPQVMPAYLTWFINQGLDRRKFKKMVQEARRRFMGQVHSRITDLLAYHYIQWQFTREFLGWQDLEEEFAKALTEEARTMNRLVQEEKAGNVFISYLVNAICTGDAYLAGTDSLDDTPHRNNAVCVGWLTPNNIYLQASSALKFVQKDHKETTGGRLEFSKDALIDQLRELDYFDDPNVTKEVQRRVGTGSPRVLILKKGVLTNEEVKPGEYLNTGILASVEDKDRGNGRTV